MSSRSVAIYALIGPDGSVGYVGKTVLPLGIRLSNHLSEARRSGKTNKRIEWINSLPTPFPWIKLIEEVVEDQWDERERFWIAHYRSIGQAQANTHPGGQRGPRGIGHPQSAETRRKISESLSGREPSASQERALRESREAPRSPAHRASSSKSMKNFWSSLSPEERARRIKAMQDGKKEKIK